MNFKNISVKETRVDEEINEQVKRVKIVYC
jgi:hypothetical protein